MEFCVAKCCQYLKEFLFKRTIIRIFDTSCHDACKGLFACLLQNYK